MRLNLGEDDTATTAAAKTVTRTYLEDGDAVVLRGEAQTAEGVRIGFGECRGVVLPANKFPDFHAAGATEN